MDIVVTRDVFSVFGVIAIVSDHLTNTAAW